MEREKAVLLRRRGKSISEIADELKMNKSTVSIWCRDVRLAEAQQKRIALRQSRGGRIGLLKAAEMKRTRRIEDTRRQYSLGAADVGQITPRDIFFLGLGLYWGEGYKKGSGEFGFTNSNPAIIRAFLTWITKTYGVKKQDLILRVSINQRHRDKTLASIRYWSRITGARPDQFTKTSLIRAPQHKIFVNSDSYYGTLRIKVRRGTSLLRRVLGSIEQVGHVVE